MESPELEKNVRFVAGHYRKEAFDKRRAWQKVSTGAKPWWRRHFLAAAVAAGCIITATATVVYFVGSDNRVPTVDVYETPTYEMSRVVADSVARFEFNGTALSVAVEKIETTYGITLTGLPENDPLITLKYEGTADELVKLINESVDSNIRIER